MNSLNINVLFAERSFLDEIVATFRDQSRARAESAREAKLISLVKK